MAVNVTLLSLSVLLLLSACSHCILLFYGSKLVFKDLRLYCLFYNPISILLFCRPWEHDNGTVGTVCCSL